MTRPHFTVPGRRASPGARQGGFAAVHGLAGLLAVVLGVLATGPAPARDAGAGGPLREVMAAEFAVSAGRLDEAVRCTWRPPAPRPVTPRWRRGPPATPCWAATMTRCGRRWPCG